MTDEDVAASIDAIIAAHRKAEQAAIDRIFARQRRIINASLLASIIACVIALAFFLLTYR